MITEYRNKPPETGYVRVYTYEYLENDSWIASNFNWTTAEALLDYLSIPCYYTTRKVIYIDILIEDLKKNLNMPFVSDFVYEKLGIK